VVTQLTEYKRVPPVGRADLTPTVTTTTKRSTSDSTVVRPSSSTANRWRRIVDAWRLCRLRLVGLLLGSVSSRTTDRSWPS